MSTLAAMNKHVQFGFGIQDAQGQVKTTGLTWLPLRGTTGLNDNPNMQVIDQADSYEYERLPYPGGIWVEGGINVSPIPGSMANLLTWIQERDSYNQGKYATVVLYDQMYQRQYQDVKVETATFRLTAGEPLSLELACRGIRPYTSTTISLNTVDTGGPFLWPEAVVQVDWDNTGTVHASAETTIRELEFTIENSVLSGEEGLALNSSFYPAYLWNTAALKCTGRFTRWYMPSATEANDPYTRWLAQMTSVFSNTHKAMMTTTLTRGGSTLTLAIADMRFETVTQEPAGSREGMIMQEVTFRCLSADGATAPIVLS